MTTEAKMIDEGARVAPRPFGLRFKTHSAVTVDVAHTEVDCRNCIKASTLAWSPWQHISIPLPDDGLKMAIVVTHSKPHPDATASSQT